MGPMRKHVCAAENKGIDKGDNFKSKSASFENSVSVNLVRIEDDPELLLWIEKNVKTEINFKALKRKTSGNGNMQTRTSGKTVTREQNKKFTKAVGNKHLPGKQQTICSRLRQNTGKGNKILLCKVIPAVKVSRKQMLKESQPSSVNTSVNRTRRYKTNNGVKIIVRKTSRQVKRPSASITECKDGLIVKKLKEDSTEECSRPSAEQSSIDQKFPNGCRIASITNLPLDIVKDSTKSPVSLKKRKISKSHKTLLSNSTAKILSQNMGSVASDTLVSLKTVTKRNGLKNSVALAHDSNKLCNKEHSVTVKDTDDNDEISISIEESINLISQLTGCNIHPSKVKVLPLPESNIPENSKLNLTTPVSKKTDLKNLSRCEPPLALSGVNNKNNVCGNSESFSNNSSVVNKSVKQTECDNVRTVYDLMKEMSVILPSWNLHILPDTNTFCIGQVTRDSLGIPHLSKCIELDDNFNAKVYIYEQHCEMFDGVYDSEDAVVALINKIDSY